MAQTVLNQKLKTKNFHLLLVYGFYLLVAVIVTYPLIANLSTALAGFVYGDGYEMAHHLWWFKHALQTGQPLFYQTMSAYPVGIEGVTLWADPLQFFPAWALAFVLPLPAAANLTILLTLALNGLAMFVLARYLITPHPPAPFSHTGGEKGEKNLRAYVSEEPGNSAKASRGEGQALIPALIAGLVFMLYPTMQGHLGAGHAGLLVQWPLPIYVYALLRLLDRGGWRQIALAALFFFLSAGGHTLQLIYTLLPVTVVYGLLLIARREWTALRRAVVAAGIGAVCLGAFLFPVLRATLGTSAYTEEGGAVRYSADLLAVVTPSFRHPLFGRLDYTSRVLGVNIDEGAAYLGIIAAALALVAVWKVRASRWWLALALVAWVLALGPLLKIFDQPVSFTVDGYNSYVTLPFALISNLPLISLARTPGRFDFALALGVAALVGYGAAFLFARMRLNRVMRWAAAALLMAGIGFEYQVFWPLPLSPAAIPSAIADLAGREDVRAVLDVPWDNLVAAKDGLYLQTAHERPLIAGHVTRSTPVSPAKLTLLQTTLDPPLLRSVGADAVILHREQDGDGTLEARARAQLGDPVYEDASLALFLTPQTDAKPAFLALPASDQTLTAQADSYVYAPEDGWITLSADLQAGDARQVSLLLDGVIAGRWTVEGEKAISVPLPVSAGSFGTISLALDPACPAHFDAALECRSVALSKLALDFVPSAAGAAADFEKGVTLAAARVPAEALAGESLAIWLWWQFEQQRSENEVRFVHVTDAAGNVVAQQDNTLGMIAAGESRAEQVELALPADLPPGEYTVSTGWYSYPDITNFCVLRAGACGESVLTLGTVTVNP